MISSATSMKFGYSQNWSTIGLSFRSWYSDFSMTILYSWLVIYAWYLEFLIIGLLYYAQCYWGFLYLKYSGLFSENSITKQRYQISIIWHRSKIYAAESAEDIYVPIIFSQHGRVTLSYSYLDWYNSCLCPLCVHFTPSRNCEDVNFCKVDGM